MSLTTIAAVGGGYAGVHLLEDLKTEFAGQIGKSIRIVLIDKNPYHFRKVML
jgi:NADH dehydrogenase